MDSLAAYQRTLVWTGQRIAGVRPDDLALPTPCQSWDVRAVVAHLVAGIWYFQALVAAEPLEGLVRDLSGLVGDDAFGSYDRAARAGLEAWGRPGALDAVYAMPLGETPGHRALAIHHTDVLVHGWDVAEATHQDSVMEDDVADFALGSARVFIQTEMRGPGRAYADARPEPDSSRAQERLLAFVGRDPMWRP